LEDAPNGVGAQGTAIVSGHILKNLVFTLRLVDRQSSCPLNPADLFNNARPFVEQLKQPQVYRIDTLAACGQRFESALSGHRSPAAAPLGRARSNPCLSSRTKDSSCSSRDVFSRFRSIRLTIALPTTTPSTTLPSSATCSGLEIPNPTASGRFVTARTARTSGITLADNDSRSPVTPVRETRYTNPVEYSASRRSRRSVLVGAAKNTVSRPCPRIAST